MVKVHSSTEQGSGISARNPSLSLYTVFHLNLFYSSIEEKQRPEVITRCYWPLLRLAKQYQLPFGIEATGMTLEAIAEIDSTWLSELRELISMGSCEFIGSGYAQLVGPLVPAEVNAMNLKIGHQIYEKVLGIRPTVALVNEQAWSAGLVHHYIQSGFRAIMMEWDNPSRHHPEWDPEWRYFPQYACGQGEEMIPVIWDTSIAFQQFQRYAHGESCLDDYLHYLSKHVSGNSRMFPLYANDAEIFDFRPNRYATEAVCHEESEWSRIAQLFEKLRADSRFSLIQPSQVLDALHVPEAGHRLRLESVQQPIPVKKQGKYNILRWAVTGRADSNINALCWKAYDVLKRENVVHDDDWKELCYLWSSDFRTHITTKRWQTYKRRLEKFPKNAGVGLEPSPFSDISPQPNPMSRSSLCAYSYDEPRKRIAIENDHILATLNCRRGLAIEKLIFKELAPDPLVMTLPHGFYDDISKGADFYSGHLVLETPGQHKITDLEMVEPKIEASLDQKEIFIRGTIATPQGHIRKTITIHEGEVKITYELDWEEMPLGSLRLGHVTVNPDFFDRNSLFVESHNGGIHPERFLFNGHVIDHGHPVSFLVSASEALGMTEGVVNIGDQHQTITIRVNQGNGFLLGLVSFMPVGDSYFCRLSLSGAECDDTCLTRARTSFPRRYEIQFSANKTEEPVFETRSVVAAFETA